MTLNVYGHLIRQKHAEEMEEEPGVFRTFAVCATNLRQVSSNALKQLVVKQLPKLNVAGSTPVARSSSGSMS